MFCQPKKLARCLAIGLAAGAIAPGAASAVPIIDGQGVAAGGGPGVTADQFKSQNLTAPDQVDRVQPTPGNLTAPDQVDRVQPTPGNAQPPQWATGPQPEATRHAPATTTSPKATPSDDGGLDTGVWIAIAGGSVLALGAAGLVGQRAVVRKRQVA